MSDISKYTGRFRINVGSQDTQARKVAKRPRESLACDQCRDAKVRCNKGRPCSSCVKRNGGSSCSYQKPSAGEDMTRSVAEDRLDKLERMVTLLMQNQAAPMTPLQQPTTPPDAIDRQDRNELSAWSADAKAKYPTVLEDIMNSIHDLKLALPEVREEVERMPSAEYRMRGSERIFGSASSRSIEEVLKRYMPSREESDRLLEVFFVGDTFILPFIHAQQFRREYVEFWSQPGVVSPLWLSLLFSALNLSSMAGEGAAMASAQVKVAGLSPGFHAAAGECLVIGHYYRAQPYGPEALLFYAHCVSMKTLDPSREAGAMMSMAVRIAYEMGYHRDPDFFGSFSVFEGEMRRRFWAGFKQIDMMLAFQLGLPCNIRLENCDTRSPRNLLDSDFGPDSTELPPSRPESEATGLLWFIVKDRLVPSFSKVCQDALSLRLKSESEVRTQDEEIRMAKETVPDVLRVRRIPDCLGDPPFLIMTRFYLELLSLKSLCILHRKYMTQGNEYSTEKCIEAGLSIVRLVINAYKEFAPGGQLYEVKWMFNCYYFNDFLLGVIVLCLYTNICLKRSVGAGLPTIGVGSEIFALLEQSHTICVEKASASRDARKVSLAIRLVLRNAATASVRNRSSAEERIDVTDPTPLTQVGTEFDRRPDGSSWCSPTSMLEGPQFEALDPFSFMSTEGAAFDGVFAGFDPPTWDDFMFPSGDE
ncbi:hypothetical protein, variant 2 [Verruconis gallopava]|uniref:Zn(2)-C6 fungal-type domain-containing protein n=1 Tax=Verruconis gallopava TaxID=253628 RepID=A0A0D1Z3M4_9PEZI|nr:uncharacterized protein PV09_01501 [Verruconis gallopava]XP_016217410.1 hypothetical protein, variant 1 [Verruconis gallopava]XP_016217411.1 hypothetical protein, variant 2 [Verruconis gallopava]KIW07540.1 hypothetical protein PV09_01501 [Verruconis gallopava]KIW07541.1 hypothetical protein, variant 1 [Verruconis gallopava]KIW07542.1 hypothetical protein, variant 2 [Verruconis gallopava]